MRLAVALLLAASPLQAQVAFDSLRVLPLDVISPLGGRIPGVLVLPGARPGLSAGMAIRGRGGPTGINSPLFLIDGVVSENGVEGLDPATIDSVEVLKGAAAAALYGARAGDGVILIRTRRPARAERLRLSARTEVSATSLAGEPPLATTSTAMIADESGARFCFVDPGQRLCERTFDWALELARVNNAPGDTTLTPVSPVGIAMSAAGLGVPAFANNFQARDLPGTLYQDQIGRLTGSSLLSFASADAHFSSGGTALNATVSRLSDPGVMRFRDGYQRLAARLGLERRFGERWSLSLRAFGSTARNDSHDAFLDERVLFEAGRMPANADLLARDSLGRPYAVVSLSNGNLTDSPGRNLQGSVREHTFDRLGVSATARYRLNDWADVHASAGIDNASSVRDGFFDPLGRGAPIPGAMLEASSNGLALGAGVLMRRALGRDLRSMTRLGVDYVKQSEDAHGVLGNFIEDLSFKSKNVGIVAATSVIWRERLIVDAGVRHESFDFAGADRSKLFPRVGLTWMPSERLRLRAARGVAGGRPNYLKATEVSQLSVYTLGVPPSGRRTETELGAEVTLFGGSSLSLVHAFATSADEPFLVPLPAQQGFAVVWQPIGDVSSRSWELALSLPLIRRANVEWSWRIAIDRSSATFERLTVPPFSYGFPAHFVAREGERVGEFYGRRFVTSCAELPASFRASCGDGLDFQRNDDGLIVYAGAGRTWRDGITDNLWGTQLAGAQAPWGVPLYWGAPITVRDTMCVAAPNPMCAGLQSSLGNAIPESQIGVSTSFRLGRLSIFALLNGQLGREVWNASRQWSYLAMTNPDLDQRSETVETARPIGYYLRPGPADGFSGMGGLYDILAPNNWFVEDASFVKLRELAVTLSLGRVGSLGNWSISVTGRNLLTFTGYGGLDPEVPLSLPNFGGFNSADDMAVPPARSFGVTLSAAF